MRTGMPSERQDMATESHRVLDTAFCRWTHLPTARSRLHGESKTSNPDSLGCPRDSGALNVPSIQRLSTTSVTQESNSSFCLHGRLSALRITESRRHSVPTLHRAMNLSV